MAEHVFGIGEMNLQRHGQVVALAAQTRSSCHVGRWEKA
jgi:hypothetical protein